MNIDRPIRLVAPVSREMVLNFISASVPGLQVAIVAGGARGTGLAIAEAVAPVTAEGATIAAVPCDVTSERDLARVVRECLDPGQVARLETNVEELQKAVAAGDTERIADLGYAFHRQINLAAASHRLALLLGAVVNHLPNRFYASIEAQVAATRDEHPQLVEALRRHDVRTARSLMEQHILGSADHLIEILEERGLWASRGSDARESAS
jgi:NAD(P)-dependent dehydrogenase (short-subunit alcohol dehydrogenase family)